MEIQVVIKPKDEFNTENLGWSEPVPIEEFILDPHNVQFDCPYLQYHNLETDSYIWFYQETETIEIQFDITMDLLKAINQQCKELGWDND